MKAIAVAPLLLFLSACGPSKEGTADLAGCREAALRDFPGDSDAISEAQKSCMAAKGYHFSSIAYSCGRGDLYSDAACYVR
ncbi:MAG TPA: hypothetical protein VGH40_08200 [Roseiarcus sp.]|jgi:hypothetical protein